MASGTIVRRGGKRTGFRYETESGRRVTAAATLARIDRLRIPPAWTEVHIAASPTAAIQAWGFDAKGRKQYRYHERAVEQGQLRKYYRVRRLAHDLPRLRAAVERDMRRRSPDQRRVAAGVVRLIGEAFFRVGSERYAAENNTFGISTLRKEHVTIHDDRVVFCYVGKKSIEQCQSICDVALVRFVRLLVKSPGPRLFRWRDDDGAWHDLTARDVNDYLHDVLETPYTAKDFRTWGGTLRVATILADLGDASSAREAEKNVLTALRLVAAADLGNTPTVCRASYVHPLVIARYLDERATIAPFLPNGNARSSALAREEQALIRFLDKYFPERRHKKRDRRRRLRDADDRRDLRAA